MITRLTGAGSTVPIVARVGPQFGGEITLGTPKVQFVSQEQVTLHIPLNVPPYPRDEWIALFKSADYPMSMEEPELIGNTAIKLRVANAEMEANIQALRRRVAEANRRYAEEVEPRLQRERKEAEAKEAEQRRIYEDVTRRLEALDE